MSEKILAPNFSGSNVAEKTKVETTALAAQKVIAFESAQNFAIGDYFAIGVLGSEKTELHKVFGVASDSITTVDNLAYDHKADEPITKLNGDQIKVYYTANVNDNPPAHDDFSTFVAPVNIDPDQLNTEVIHSAGGSDYWYLFVYYNSDSTAETNKNISTRVRGGGHGDYTSVQRVRNAAGFANNRYIGDEKIREELENAQSEVNGSLIVGKYTLQMSDPIPATVRKATTMLAAGFLLLGDYGIGAEGTNKDGMAKIKMARSMLKSFIDANVVLVDEAGAEKDQDADLIDSGFPDASTSEDRLFKINDTY